MNVIRLSRYERSGSSMYYDKPENDGGFCGPPSQTRTPSGNLLTSFLLKPPAGTHARASRSLSHVHADSVVAINRRPVSRVRHREREENVCVLTRGLCENPETRKTNERRYERKNVVVRLFGATVPIPHCVQQSAERRDVCRH